MDRVRLGRVLGRGARMAARTAYEALDAATAPEPPSRTASPTPRAVAERVQLLRPVAGRVVTAARATGGRAGMFAPVRRASRAVSLEVTGSFFALFALSFGLGMWHARDELHAGPHGVARFGAYAAIALFFAYCAGTSFQRARRLK